MRPATALPTLGALLLATTALAAESSPAPRSIEIATLTCKEIMAADDQGRAASLAFFHGYLAGKKDSKSIELNTASDITDKVKDFCLSNPSATVLDAFSKSGK